MGQMTITKDEINLIVTGENFYLFIYFLRWEIVY